MATTPKTATAEAFLKKFVEGTQFDAIDTQTNDLSSIQPRVGREKECIDEFLALHGEVLSVTAQGNSNKTQTFASLPRGREANSTSKTI